MSKISNYGPLDDENAIFQAKDRIAQHKTAKGPYKEQETIMRISKKIADSSFAFAKLVSIPHPSADGLNAVLFPLAVPAIVTGVISLGIQKIAEARFGKSIDLWKDKAITKKFIDNLSTSRIDKNVERGVIDQETGEILKTLRETNQRYRSEEKTYNKLIKLNSTDPHILKDIEKAKHNLTEIKEEARNKVHKLTVKQQEKVNERHQHHQDKKLLSLANTFKKEYKSQDGSINAEDFFNERIDKEYESYLKKVKKSQQPAISKKDFMPSVIESYYISKGLDYETRVGKKINELNEKKERTAEDNIELACLEFLGPKNSHYEIYEDLIDELKKFRDIYKELQSGNQEKLVDYSDFKEKFENHLEEFTKKHELRFSGFWSVEMDRYSPPRLLYSIKDKITNLAFNQCQEETDAHIKKKEA